MSASGHAPKSLVSQTIKLSAPATREFWEIPVLFEDAHLLALDKPAGLLTSPDRDNPDRPNLMRLLHDGIAAGKTATMEWSKSTDNGNCEWYFKARLDNGEETEPVEFDFCEKNLVLEIE